MSEAKRDLLALDELSPETILLLLKRAQVMRDAWNARRMPQALTGRRVALVVDDGGWRNTTAFEIGIKSMGGRPIEAVLADSQGKVDVAASEIEKLNEQGIWETLDMKKIPNYANVRPALRSPYFVPWVFGGVTIAWVGEEDGIRQACLACVH